MREKHPWSGGYYKPGDYWHECERCGFDYYWSELLKEPKTGAMVCKPCADMEPSYQDNVED